MVHRTDEQWVRRGLALLEMSAGALALSPTPSRHAVRTFAEVARGLAERCPTWLTPWPVLELETAGDDDAPLAALTLEHIGTRLVARETPPAPDGYSVVVLLEYYLHLIHDHLRARRLAARRPGRVTELLPGEQARLAEAFEEVDQVLREGAGGTSLAGLWAALA
jgi:hypothetical protein